MIELRKHLDRSEDKLKSAHILLENNQITDSIGEAYYSIYHIIWFSGVFSSVIWFFVVSFIIVSGFFTGVVSFIIDSRFSTGLSMG